MFGRNNNPEESRFETEQIKTDGPIPCHIITDKETGVQYLYAWGGAGGGVTPLLDENGQVVIKSRKNRSL
ncbi:DUF6440 family protein [Salinicoccus hispanicus]|uniref:DUF6440 domain-containing protein n=1 Tax=Salinicoccus hispanicus TaxID=157225 RepID=A0A6N8TYA9_9STAP|nr:DUF6440 family protein [Salinicoccus hispanicus]MXQ50472.1 hypothetical protein [Salinicoccus hispanicus]